MAQKDVLIVGGGLTGLSCAKQLQQQDISFQLLEASDQVGGRVRTDEVDGFLLDRGFQVFLTAYPEAKDLLEYGGLDLKPFEPGALIRFNGKFRRLVDPWRRPQHLFATAFSPVASIGDKLRVARLRNRVCGKTLDDIYSEHETTTIERLRERGFTDRIIKRFFRPFLGGVFLDLELKTSSRLFEFVFRMFSLGDAALPAAGMQAIPKQLAASLPPDSVRTNSPARAVESERVLLESGEELTARFVVVATEEPVARKLLSRKKDVSRNSVCCLYYAANRPPIEEPILILNGEDDGPINNLCVPSQVSSRYAPDGKSLVSATVLDYQGKDDQELDASVRGQLQDWFGTEVNDWPHLKTYRIDYALPRQDPPNLSPVRKSATTEQGVFVCGDYLNTASINGAMESGRRAAEAIVKELRPH